MKINEEEEPFLAECLWRGTSPMRGLLFSDKMINIGASKLVSKSQLSGLAVFKLWTDVHVRTLNPELVDQPICSGSNKILYNLMNPFAPKWTRAIKSSVKHDMF